MPIDLLTTCSLKRVLIFSQDVQTSQGLVTVQPSDLADGHREHTLGLLWRLIVQWQIPQLVDLHAVRVEIQRLALRPNQVWDKDLMLSDVNMRRLSQKDVASVLDYTS